MKTLAGEMAIDLNVLRAFMKNRNIDNLNYNPIITKHRNWSRYNKSIIKKTLLIDLYSASTEEKDITSTFWPSKRESP